jgi:transcription initiation factor TFIID TATA-box-binding protein
MKGKVPTIEDCKLTPQNWVITCTTEICSSERGVPYGDYASVTGYRPINFRALKQSKSISKTTTSSGKKRKRASSIAFTDHKNSNLETKTNFSINLFETAKRMRHLGVQYNPSSFHALILKMRQPSGAVLIFSTGTIVCTGPKRQYVATYLLNYSISLLREHGYPGLRIRPGSWSIENVVADATLPSKINLNYFYARHSECCNYEPSIFPGVTYRKTCEYTKSKGTTITILLYNSGRLVITGAKNEQHIKDVLTECLPEIWEARSKNTKK